MSRKPKTTQTALISRLHDPTPASCRVNPLGATTDFTQQDMLDGPSCGDAMRPEGGSRSGGNSSRVWDCDACCFSIEFSWLRLLYGVSYFLVQLVPVCWCFEIFWDTTIVLGEKYGVEWGKGIPIPTTWRIWDLDVDEPIVLFPFRELIGALL